MPLRETSPPAPVIITDITGDDPTVEYRQVPGHLGYAVGTDGSLWSRRDGQGGLRDQWEPLKPWRTARRYRGVTIDGRLYLVHTLVLTAFLGPRPPGKIGCHADDDPQNNRLENLRWCTHRENAADSTRNRARTGKPKKGSKLTVAIVRLVRALARDGWRQSDIALLIGVSANTVSDIERGKRWEWLVD